MKSTTFGGTLLVLAAALLILGIAFAQEAGGTGGAGGATQNATASDQEQQEKRYHFVVVENGMFSPDNLFIFAGDCVVWSDLQGHNVIQVNSTNSSVPLEGGFNSDLAKSNQTTGSGVVLNETVPVEYFSKCFDAVGEYFYISNRNASFLIGGAIIVMELPTACDANQTVTFSGTSLGLNLTAPVGILKVVDNIAGGDLASSPSSASWLVLGLKNGEIQYIDMSQIGSANATTPSTLLKLGNVLYEPEADGTSIPVRGLLGMAFDPNFNSTGRFFVHYTAPYQSEASGNATANATAANKAINCLAMNGTEYCNLQTFDHVQRIEEYKWANGTSTLVRSLLVLRYPFFDHVGKNTLAFAEEGHLIVTIGDGGCARNDPLELAQNDLSFFGKIWRIDIVHLDLLISNQSLAECSFPPNGVFNITELNDICTNYSQIFLLDSLGIRSPAGLAVIPGLSNVLFLDQLEDGTEINIANGMMQNFGWPLVSGYQCRIAQPGFSEGMCLATIPMDNITAADNSTALPANANATNVGGMGNNTSGSGMHGEFYIKVPASVVADTYVAAGAWFGFNVECPLRGSFLFSRFGKLSYLPLYSPYSYLGEVVSLSEICSLANDNSTSNATEPASGASANATTVSTGGNASNTTGTSSEEIPSGLDEMDNMGEQVQDLTVEFADAAQFDAITALTSSQITNDIFVAGKLSAGSFAVYRIQRAAQGAA